MPVERLRRCSLGHRPELRGGRRQWEGQSERGGVAARDDDVTVKEFQQVLNGGLRFEILGN
jgi:hypothetical protein